MTENPLSKVYMNSVIRIIEVTLSSLMTLFVSDWNQICLPTKNNSFVKCSRFAGIRKRLQEDRNF